MNELLISRLRTARIDKKLKQQDVANKLGIKPNTLSNWEKGRTEPDIDTFVKLCEIYEIDCAELLSDVYAYKRISSDVSVTEYEMIKKFRELDDTGKELITSTLDKIYIMQNPPRLPGQTSIFDIIPLEDINIKLQENACSLNAAHADNYMDAQDDLKNQEEDIMDDDNF